MGALAITAKLNRDKVPVISDRKKIKTWNIGAVKYFLTSRTLIGEYQPQKAIDRTKRVNDGEPIKGYYPALITEEEYYRLQAIRNARKRYVRGRAGKDVPNLFGRLLRYGPNNSTMVLNHRSGDTATVTMVPANSRHGLGTGGHFNYNDFEKFTLLWLTEVDLQATPPTELAVGLAGW